MIEIIDGYVIDVDPLNYTVKKETGNVNKEGKKTYRTYGYYGSLKGALKGCIEAMQKEKLDSDTFPLEEAIKASNRTVGRFNELLELAIKECKEG